MNLRRKCLMTMLIVYTTIRGTTGIASQRPECSRDLLTGNWTLISAEDFIAGKWVRPFGDQPRGYFSFSNDGLASVQFMKFPPDGDSATDSTRYLAYFREYSVDENKCTFTVSIEGSPIQKLVGTKAERSFRIDGGSTLYVGDGASFRRTFKRMVVPPAASSKNTDDGRRSGH